MDETLDWALPPEIDHAFIDPALLSFEPTALPQGEWHTRIGVAEVADASDTGVLGERASAESLVDDWLLDLPAQGDGPTDPFAIGANDGSEWGAPGATSNMDDAGQHQTPSGSFTYDSHYFPAGWNIKNTPTTNAPWQNMAPPVGKHQLTFWLSSCEQSGNLLRIHGDLAPAPDIDSSEAISHLHHACAVATRLDQSKLQLEHVATHRPHRVLTAVKDLIKRHDLQSTVHVQSATADTDLVGRADRPLGLPLWQERYDAGTHFLAFKGCPPGSSFKASLGLEASDTGIITAVLDRHLTHPAMVRDLLRQPILSAGADAAEWTDEGRVSQAFRDGVEHWRERWNDLGLNVEVEWRDDRSMDLMLTGASSKGLRSVTWKADGVGRVWAMDQTSGTDRDCGGQLIEQVAL